MAEAGGTVLGYVDLEPDGHIDHLFCAPEAVGRGIGAWLCDAVEAAALDCGLTRLHVEASEPARRLFDKKGFVVRERRETERRGVRIRNYAMEKLLAAPSWTPRGSVSQLGRPARGCAGRGRCRRGPR